MVSTEPTERSFIQSSQPPFQDWLKAYGETEYEVYKKHATGLCLSYEEWTKSDRVLGPYLYYVTEIAFGLSVSTIFIAAV